MEHFLSKGKWIAIYANLKTNLIDRYTERVWVWVWLWVLGVLLNTFFCDEVVDIRYLGRIKW